MTTQKTSAYAAFAADYKQYKQEGDISLKVIRMSPSKVKETYHPVE